MAAQKGFIRRMIDAVGVKTPAKAKKAKAKAAPKAKKTGKARKARA